MADPRSVRHIKALRELYARIISQRVLCIDNNPYFREFVCWFLSDIGCEVKGVATAMEGLSMIRQEPAGYNILIVADWLPDMDGVELLRTLRLIPYSGRIAVTAPQLSRKQRAIYDSLGVSSILITPVGYCELMRILEPAVSTDNASGHERDKATYGQALPSSTR
jgi:DNA-binding response OmpR family regulator